MIIESTTVLLFVLRVVLLVALYLFLGTLAWLVWRDLRRGTSVAEQSGAPRGSRLTVIASGESGYAEGRQFPMRAVTTMGRDLSNDIVIADSYASTRHARVERQEDGRFWLVDLGSRNGTFLNGQQVRPNVPVPLDGGDVIKIGKVELKVG